ncbi:MAG: chemotaxis protein CheD [Clostridiales bacterium]|jgi:chemotaxis protein CheD|nr:chemotaxis protein CheD [Clostridiales bacterium]
MNKDIMVGIADYKVASGPFRIITVGLGSCVGISIYDTGSMSGGMAHIMLPDSTKFHKVDNEAKFADLAIPKMVSELEKLGIKRRNMAAKIAGGASMFQFADSSLNTDIGRRNAEAVRTVLRKLGIPLLAEDTGGNTGRTMILDLETGNVFIRMVGKEPKLL